MSYLQQIDNKEFVKELVRRNNKGVINLNLVGCCQILHYILLVKNHLQKPFQEPNKDLPYGDHCFAMIDIFIPSLFIVLKKENKLCSNCLEWLEKIDEISQSNQEQEINQKQALKN